MPPSVSIPPLASGPFTPRPHSGRLPGRLRILHVVGERNVPMDLDAEAASGMVRSTMELAAQQARAGHEPWVVSFDRTRASGTWRGVRLERLRLLPWATLRVPGRGRLDVSGHLPLAWLTWCHRFDVIHGQMYPYLRFLRGRAKVAHFRTDPEEAGPSLARFAFTSDVQIGASRFIAEELRQGLGPAGDVHTVSNGIDVARYDAVARSGARSALRRELGLDDDDFAFLYAGAIVPVKGVLELARAFGIVAEARPRSHLLLAGASHLWGAGGAIDPHRGYEAEVRRVLEPLRQAGRVHVLGKLEAGRMDAAYAASDAVVVPSIWREGFGRVAVEALASRRPVIATGRGGLREIVSDETGALVPAGDVGALSTAMERLAGDEAAYLRRRRRCRDAVALYDLDRVCEDMDRVYAHALSKGARRGRRARIALGRIGRHVPSPSATDFGASERYGRGRTDDRAVATRGRMLPSRRDEA